MAEDLGLFNTPRLKYLSLKKRFFSRFLDPKVWGELGSKELVIAISGLLEYLEETMNLADEFPNLLSDVIVDNKNLLLGRVLPFPAKLYEQLIGAAFGEEHQLVWQQSPRVILTRISSFLVRKKAASLAAYEHQVGLEVEAVENYNFDNYENAECGSVANTSNSETVKRKQLLTRAQLRKMRNKFM